jgi:hypothetical protein
VSLSRSAVDLRMFNLPAETAPMTKKSKPCPKCGGEAVPVIYGFPSPEVAEAHSRGEIEMGGCIAGQGRPTWRCKMCGYGW